LRALVVDDNVDAATSLSYLLQLLGCKTAVAFGGTMALRVAQLFQPSLVFLDLDMPGQDGCETLVEIRNLGGAVSSALFVCLTGRSEPADEKRCLDAGFDHFVAKPMEPDVLREVLEEAGKKAARADQASPHAFNPDQR
jgi:CheY-like chemotaxis protein